MAERLALVPTEWSDQVEQWLSRCRWDELYSLDDFQRDAASGRIGLFLCQRGDQAEGVIAVRKSGAELVQVVLGGEFGSLRRMMEYEPALRDLARHMNCSTIRGHVAQPGLIATYQKHGYEIEEVIVRKWL